MSSSNLPSFTNLSDVSRYTLAEPGLYKCVDGSEYLVWTDAHGFTYHKQLAGATPQKGDVLLETLARKNEDNLRLQLDVSILRHEKEELLEDLAAAKEICYELQTDAEKDRKAKQTVVGFLEAKSKELVAMEKSRDYFRERCADLSDKYLDAADDAQTHRLDAENANLISGKLWRYLDASKEEADALKEQLRQGQKRERELADENEELKFMLVNLRRGVEKRRKVVKDPKSGGRYWGFFDDQEWRAVHKVVEDKYDPIYDVEVEVPEY